MIKIYRQLLERIVRNKDISYFAFKQYDKQYTDLTADIMDFKPGDLTIRIYRGGIDVNAINKKIQDGIFPENLLENAIIDFEVVGSSVGLSKYGFYFVKEGKVDEVDNRVYIDDLFNAVVMVITASELKGLIEKIDRPKPKFKVGDTVKATCKKNKPYFITYEGWTGTVADVDGNMIKVTGINLSHGSWVDEIYFDIVSKVDAPCAKSGKDSVFKVGDKVIGLPEANRYGVTKEGWIGTVTDIHKDGKISVKGKKGDEPFGPVPVEAQYFRHYLGPKNPCCEIFLDISGSIKPSAGFGVDVTWNFDAMLKEIKKITKEWNEGIIFKPKTDPNPVKIKPLKVRGAGLGEVKFDIAKYSELYKAMVDDSVPDWFDEIEASFKQLASSWKSKTPTQKENKDMATIDTAVLLELAGGNKDAELAKYTKLPGNIQEALKKKLEEREKQIAEKAADEVVKLMDQTETVVKQTVDEMRDLNARKKKLKAYLDRIERAQAYGFETSNWIPLIAIQTGYIPPRMAEFAKIPEDWAPAVEAEVTADKKK